MEVLEKIKNNAEEKEIFFAIHFVLSQTEKFLSERQELSLLHIRAFQLYGRYSMILLASTNAFDQLEKINESVGKVTDKMWIVVPRADLNNPEYLKDYLRFVDKEKYSKLSEQCSKSHLYVAGGAGNVRGQLTKGIAEYNLSFLYNMIRKGKMFVDFWFAIKKLDKEHRADSLTEPPIDQTPGQP